MDYFAVAGLIVIAAISANPPHHRFVLARVIQKLKH
jgi:hypothetical protein